MSSFLLWILSPVTYILIDTMHFIRNKFLIFTYQYITKEWPHTTKSSTDKSVLDRSPTNCTAICYRYCENCLGLWWYLSWNFMQRILTLISTLRAKGHQHQCQQGNQQWNDDFGIGQIRPQAVLLLDKQDLERAWKMEVEVKWFSMVVIILRSDMKCSIKWIKEV